MRSKKLIAFLLVSSSLSLLAGACNNTDPSRLYAEASWKMRCPSADELGPTTGCAAGCSDGMDRWVANFTGEEGARVSCSVTETATQRFVSFEVMAAGGQRISFENVGFLTAGGSATGGRVHLYEDNDYVGAAGSAAPSSAQPCQVTGVTFTLDEGDPTVRGNVYCRMMRASANGSLCRGLSTPSALGSATTPAEFMVAGCTGLTIAAP